MRPTETLLAEHRIIERVLAILETGAWYFDQDENLDPDFFLRATDFITGFADGCHHKKEEGVLFKAMLENDKPQADGPVAAMLYEHELARGYTRCMRLAAQRVKDGDPTAQPELIQCARRYGALLRHHINMEDQYVFPLADRIIPLELKPVLHERFEQVDHSEIGEGVHEKFLALIEVLEQELEDLGSSQEIMSS